MDLPSLSFFALNRRIFFSERLRFLGNQSPSGPARLLLRNRAGTFWKPVVWPPHHRASLDNQNQAI